MPRVRSAKTAAKRIDLQYFTRLHGFRRWRRLLSIALPLIGIGWLVAELAAGNRNLYSSGPVSPAHAVFGENCNLCHVRGASYSAGVDDKACLVCHNAPVHSGRQVFTPRCTSCHVEHQGRPRLAETSDAGCTQCHADLHTKDGAPKVDAHVADWDKRHPQFLPLKQGQSDPGTIKLNHYVHLLPTLRGPRGPVQMQCEDCHRSTRINDTWPYSVAAIESATQQPVKVFATEAQQQKRRSMEIGASAYMAPIKYVNQCAGCHVLQFDPLITEPAPHDKPEVVRAFIVRSLTEYAATHPDAVRQPTAIDPQQVEPIRSILSPLRAAPIAPPPTTSARPPSSAPQWVEQRALAAERLLWTKNCKICHAQTEEADERLPSFVKAVIPTRWLVHAEFDHQAHRMMTCISCHSRIPQSKQTADVNLPGIETCRKCHAVAGLAKHAAEGRCFECHSYHDWRREERIKGKFDLVTLRGKGARQQSSPAEQTPGPAQPGR